MRCLWRGLVIGTLVAGVKAGAAPFAYITNSNDGTVTVIDTATEEVTGTIVVGGVPWGVAVNRTGSRVYVAGGSLSVIDASTATVQAVVPVKAAIEVEVNPQTETVYVRGQEGVSVINPANNAVETVAPIGGVDLAVAPEGSRLY